MTTQPIALEDNPTLEELVARARVKPGQGGARGTNLYTNLIARLFTGTEALRVVAFTSCSPNEGVSFTVTHLAPEIERTLGFRVAVVSAAEVLTGTKLAFPPARRSFTPGSKANIPPLRNHFDAVLVDTGSMSASGAVIGLARQVDGVVVIVECGKTSKQDLKRTLAGISDAGGKVAGFIFNRNKPVLPAWLENLLG